MDEILQEDIKQLYSVPEAADILFGQSGNEKVRQRKVRGLIKENKLDSIKVGKRSYVTRASLGL